MKLRLPFMTMLATLFVFTIVILIACNKTTVDKCEGIVCLNGGTCVDGKCACPDGFGGANCEVKKNPCTGIECQNGGTCVSGVCKCPDGYEGIYCEKKIDPCINIVCQNGGTCQDGKCHCPRGYEGVNCELLSNEKFLGIWHVNETGTISGSNQYDVTINAVTQITNLRISNFYNSFTSPVDISLNADSLFIPRQLVNGFEVEGWGYINAAHNTIIFRYDVTDMSNGFTDRIGFTAGQASVWTK